MEESSDAFVGDLRDVRQVERLQIGAKTPDDGDVGVADRAFGELELRQAVSVRVAELVEQIGFELGRRQRERRQLLAPCRQQLQYQVGIRVDGTFECQRLEALKKIGKMRFNLKVKKEDRKTTIQKLIKNK